MPFWVDKGRRGKAALLAMGFGAMMPEMSMDKGEKPNRSIPMLPLAQLVPTKVCLACDVCCRFPEKDSFLRPYFSREEIAEAINWGISSAHFNDTNGCQIAVVPHPDGEGYLCPAFDPETSHCRIYEARPLDCQIYPFTIMWDAEHKTVVLGWDQKCPYLMIEATTGMMIVRLLPEAEAFASQIHDRFENEEGLVNFVIRNPQVITPYQEDVSVVANLEVLTLQISNQRSS